MERFRPCKDCQKRYPGCSGNCEDYEKYMEDHRARKQYLSPSACDLYLADKRRERKKK